MHNWAWSQQCGRPRFCENGLLWRCGNRTGQFVSRSSHTILRIPTNRPFTNILTGTRSFTLLALRSLVYTCIIFVLSNYCCSNCHLWTSDKNGRKTSLCWNLSLRYCRTWTKRYPITSQTRVKRVSRIHHGPSSSLIMLKRQCACVIPGISAFFLNETYLFYEELIQKKSQYGWLGLKMMDLHIAQGYTLELQRMFEHSNIIRLRFSRTNFFLRTNVRWRPLVCFWRTHRACLKVSGYKVIGRARGGLRGKLQLSRSAQADPRL